MLPRYTIFMKQLLTATLLLIFLTTQGQKNQPKSPYDDFMKVFNTRLDTVQWLCEYDKIAWWTSDSVYATSKEEQSKLGSEWFCFQSDGVWHALYGKYEQPDFKMIYHYVVDSDNHIYRTKQEIDTLTTNPFARALANAGSINEKFADTISVHCNQYIKRNKYKTLSVWLLPAFTRSGIAVYGGEFYYLFDSSGANLISKNEYSIGYKGFKPDRKKKISLDYTSFKEPPLSAIFFVWYYKDYFDEIFVYSKDFVSSVIRGDDHYTWIHAARQK